MGEIAGNGATWLRAGESLHHPGSISVFFVEPRQQRRLQQYAVATAATAAITTNTNHNNTAMTTSSSTTTTSATSSTSVIIVIISVVVIHSFVLIRAQIGAVFRQTRKTVKFPVMVWCYEMLNECDDIDER